LSCRSFVVSQCVIAAAEPVVAGRVVAVPVADACRDLLELLGGVSDGRSPRGRDHPVAVVLALAAAATVAGMKGYTAIAGWVADVPAEIVADMYRRVDAVPVGPPSKSTIWRVCTDTDPRALDEAVGTWLARTAAGYTSGNNAGGGQDDPSWRALMQVRLDGKTVRGATDSEGNQLHLLAALADSAQDGVAVVVAQAEVSGAKTAEPETARTLLARLDLDGRTVTADALHTVKATAEVIHHRKGQFVFPVKENRKALFEALDALPWRDVPITHRSVDKGHGRVTTRTIQVMPAPDDLPFPHVNQVWLVERYVTDTTGRPISAVAQLGVASHTATQASPRELARYVRGQWAIEVLHWIRDTLYREDNSTIRTRCGARVMASLRNLAVGALRLAGRCDITEATRWACRNMTRPFAILGITS
jgi:predicted transposase YbfD/YdcC